MGLAFGLGGLGRFIPSAFFLFNEYFVSTFFLLGLPSALGAAAAWVAIKKWKVDQRPFFTKHNLHPRTLAFGTGGALGGLIFMLAVLSQELLCDKQSLCDINDECVTTVSDVVYMLPLFGQIFWLIWPVAAIKIICSNKLRLIKTAGILERLLRLWPRFPTVSRLSSSP